MAIDPATHAAQRAAEVTALVDQRLRQGDALSGFDTVAAARAAGVDSERLRYQHVRALAMLGDIDKALALYRELGLGDAQDVDCLALGGRLWKDKAFERGGAARVADLEQAASAYARAFAASRDMFPGINAASVHAMLGRREEAQQLARTVLADPGVAAASDYWHAATALEAALLLNDRARAAGLGSRARALARNRPADRAITMRQMRRLQQCGAVDTALADDLIAALRPDPVAVYCGRMFRAGGEGESAAAAAIAAELDARPVSALFGALACGADILFAEAALARGIDLTVVQPFCEGDFIAQSVTSGGDGWLPRYRACRAGAGRVVVASEARYISDHCQFMLGSDTMMGLARLRARELDCDAVQLALIDPPAAARAGSTVAGTNQDMAAWAALGGATRMIVVPGLDRRLNFPPAPGIPDGVDRGLYSILFGDYAGFSSLGEVEIPRFAALAMGRIGDLLRRYDADVLYRNTWGDAVHAVVSKPLIAARIALELQDQLADLPQQLGMDAATAGMRIGLHFGPIFISEDPVVGGSKWFGLEVTRTARVEPITPTGHVYCTEPFAAMLALDPDNDLLCRYVGTVDLAKGYGQLGLNRLSPASA